MRQSSIEVRSCLSHRERKLILPCQQAPVMCAVWPVTPVFLVTS